MWHAFVCSISVYALPSSSTDNGHVTHGCHAYPLDLLEDRGFQSGSEMEACAHGSTGRAHVCLNRTPPVWPGCPMYGDAVCTEAGRAHAAAAVPVLLA